MTSQGIPSGFHLEKRLLVYISPLIRIPFKINHLLVAAINSENVMRIKRHFGPSLSELFIIG
jgi:hypothetical protein